MMNSIFCGSTKSNKRFKNFAQETGFRQMLWLPFQMMVATLLYGALPSSASCEEAKPKHWTAGSPIQTPSPTPTPIVVCVGKSTTVSVTAQDKDHWETRCKKDNAFVAADDSGDSLTYAWSETPGIFASPASASSSWTAPEEPGEYTLTCTIDDLPTPIDTAGGETGGRGDASIQATVTVKVIKVQILEPNESPVTDNNFTFNAAATGVCVVNATGTSGVNSENPALSWDLDDIASSTKTSNPNPPKGASVTFTYTGLPPTNGGFGRKTLTLSHPKACEAKTQKVEIFFTEAATNHPGEGAGVTPNWFFYWRQTAAGFGTVIYDAAAASPTIRYVAGSWVSVLNDAGTGDYSPPMGDNAGNNLNGIDNFAHACRHEGFHVTNSNNWYPGGYNAAIDADGDWIPDANEAALGGTAAAPINGGPFLPGVEDSNGDGYRDDEDYTYHAQTPWTEGSADDEDWANPGHQFTK